MQPDPNQTSENQNRPDDDSTVPVSDSTLAEGNDRSETEDVSAAAAWRVTTQEAAEALGISVEAVRARVRRGTLSREKAADGTVYVLLDADQTPQKVDPSTGRFRREASGSSEISGEGAPTDDRTRSDDATIEALREQIAMLRSEIEDRKEEARRKDAIIMALTQRFPEQLPPAVASRETPKDEAPGTAGTQEEDNSSPGEGQQTPRRRSWLMRFFYGP